MVVVWVVGGVWLLLELMVVWVVSHLSTNSHTVVIVVVRIE